MVRIDSGGKLNGAMLRAGLVDEVNVLIHPALVGGLSPASIYQAPDLSHGEEALRLKLLSSRKMKGGIVWLRYELIK